VILAGIRNWEIVASNKKSKTDLLYIYSNSQLPQLCKIANINQTILPEEIRSDAKDKGGYEFGNNISTLDQDNNLEAIIPLETENTNIVIDEDTNWDDI